MTKEEKKETRDKILKVATKVFGNDGISGARMQDIADKAGVNKALLHYYFKSIGQIIFPLTYRANSN